jgi:hypothetical protein
MPEGTQGRRALIVSLASLSESKRVIPSQNGVGEPKSLLSALA